MTPTAQRAISAQMQVALQTSLIPEDVTGWWASEKMDGVRCLWTGSSLLTRNGKRFKAPKRFTESLPKGVRLDGELWMGRGTFDQLVSTIQKKDSDWAGVRFMVFDLPCNLPFEFRQAALRGIDLPPHCWVVNQSPLESHAQLNRTERLVVAGGGEGLIIVEPRSMYRPGRSGVVVKVKRITPDLQRWQG